MLVQGKMGKATFHCRHMHGTDLEVGRHKYVALQRVLPKSDLGFRPLL